MTATMATRLENQRVLITAGAAGIGRAIAERLHSEGASLAVCDVDEKALENFQAAFPDSLAVKADVSNTAEVENFVNLANEKMGGIDALINNAGIAGPTGGVEEIDPEAWRQCIDIGLTGQFLCAHFAVPMIKAAGGGSIVNMSSVAGKFGYAFRTPYAATKFGVIGFTQSLAKELGPDKIRVNAILPGIIEGPRIDAVIQARADQVDVSFDEMKAQYVAQISMGRMTSPHDVAAMTAFLLSADGHNISGQSLGVDGNVEYL